MSQDSELLGKYVVAELLHEAFYPIDDFLVLLYNLFHTQVEMRTMTTEKFRAGSPRHLMIRTAVIASHCNDVLHRFSKYREQKL